MTLQAMHMKFQVFKVLYLKKKINQVMTRAYQGEDRLKRQQ